MLERLASLRKEMAHRNLGYFLVLSQDAHNSEYVAPCDERRQYLTGFTGSAGTAIIAMEWAELATDGRYFIQAQQQLIKAWKLRREGLPKVSPWWKAVASHARQTGRDIGVDPSLITYNCASDIISELRGSSATLRAVKPNLVDLIWGDDRPPEPTNAIEVLHEQYTGRTYSSKLTDVRQWMARVGAGAYIVTALDEICWLLNIRVVGDIEYNPVFKAFLIIETEKVTLFTSPRVLSERLACVNVRPYEAVYGDLEALSRTGTKICFSRDSASWAITQSVGLNFIDQPSIIASLKAVKNVTELSGARQAQLKCGISIVRYLCWLQELIKNGGSITEYEGSCKLHDIRTKLPEFRGESFATISSVGPNASIIHYKPLPNKSSAITDKDVYLLDTGCHFTHGTTDTTRTVHFGIPTSEEKKAYTLVLKGHIALATAVFPVGTSGIQLDPLARQFLWREGLDYNHGTGHGVGSFLNVHEGPMAISPTRANANMYPLQAGNVVSNEPGYYKDGAFGVRIESLLVARASPKTNVDTKEFLEFETITLVPLCRRLIDRTLLQDEEIAWINNYQDRVRDALCHYLNEKERSFVLENTKPL